MRQRWSIIMYHPDLKEQAMEIQNSFTPSEKLLLEKLKGKQMKGYDFHHQKPINHFMVDFFAERETTEEEVDDQYNKTLKLVEDP